MARNALVLLAAFVLALYLEEPLQHFFERLYFNFRHCVMSSEKKAQEGKGGGGGVGGVGEGGLVVGGGQQDDELVALLDQVEIQEDYLQQQPRDGAVADDHASNVFMLTLQDETGRRGDSWRQ